MQIKTTLKYHFTFTKVAIIKKRKKKITSIEEDVEKFEHLALLVGLQNGAAKVIPQQLSG